MRKTSISASGIYKVKFTVTRKGTTSAKFSTSTNQISRSGLNPKGKSTGMAYHKLVTDLLD